MNLEELLQTIFDEKLIQMILSGPKQEEFTKIKIRPVLAKNHLVFQRTAYIGTKVFHENLSKQDIIDASRQWIMNDFKQCQIQCENRSYSVLVSKKGKVTISSKKGSVLMNGKNKIDTKERLKHNRTKKYLLEEGDAVPFLQDLGVMTKEGKIVRTRYDKYRQMNRFLEFIEDVVPKLDRDRELTIIDFGCGKSYLTFAMYYYLHEKQHFDVRIIGLDLKEDVIIHCNQLAQKYGYEKLKFLMGDIAHFEGETQVDMVVTLHACDTATDYALMKAVRWGAKVILSVPCCQHEVNKELNSALLAPITDYGILKERMAALITDGLRAKKLEASGYDTQILEFVDMEHTPKNLLIRAIKNDKKKKNIEDINKVQAMMEEMQIRPTIWRED